MIGAAGNGSTTPALTPAGALLLLAGGVVLGLPGWLAYAGKWRRWTNGAYGSAFPAFPFGLAWIGAAAVLSALASLIAGLGHIVAILAYVVLGIPAVVLFGCGVVFLFWAPRRVWPLWYSEVRRHHDAAAGRRARGPR